MDNNEVLVSLPKQRTRALPFRTHLQLCQSPYLGIKPEPDLSPHYAYKELTEYFNSLYSIVIEFYQEVWD